MLILRILFKRRKKEEREEGIRREENSGKKQKHFNTKLITLTKTSNNNFTNALILYEHKL